MRGPATKSQLLKTPEEKARQQARLVLPRTYITMIVVMDMIESGRLIEMPRKR